MEGHAGESPTLASQRTHTPTRTRIHMRMHIGSHPLGPPRLPSPRIISCIIKSAGSNVSRSSLSIPSSALCLRSEITSSLVQSVLLVASEPSRLASDSTSFSVCHMLSRQPQVKSDLSKRVFADALRFSRPGSMMCVQPPWAACWWVRPGRGNQLKVTDRSRPCRDEDSRMG